MAGPMKRSTDRILTTHVGSLIRPPKLQEFLRARQKGEGFEYHLLTLAITAFLMIRGAGAFSLDRAIATAAPTLHPGLAHS